MPTNERHSGGVDGETLVAYLRGELEGADRERVRAHLDACETCAREARAYEGVVARLRQLPNEPAVRDLSADVLARLDGEDARAVHARVSRRFRVLALAAAAMLAVAGGWFAALSLRTPVAPSDQVALALDWLAASQEPDGSWDPARWGGEEDYRVGITALALLALSDSDRAAAAHPATVTRATRYLLAQQGKSGAFGPFFSAMLYNHGITTVALLERYERTRDASLREPIGRALGVISSEQQPAGGWGYLKSEANTSISAWQLQALLLASGLDWPETRAAADRGLTWVEGTLDASGRAGYARAGDFPYGNRGLTAMASVCLAMGRRPSERNDAGLVDAAATGLSDTDYVQVYYLAQALEVAERRGRAGDPELMRLSARLRRVVAERQIRRGPDSGSWDPADRWGRAGGRVYATAMGALSLQASERARRLAECCQPRAQ